MNDHLRMLEEQTAVSHLERNAGVNSTATLA